jgi:hypothetical protein
MSAAIAAATTPSRIILRRALENATSTKLAANDAAHHSSATVSVILANFTLRQINRHTTVSAISTHGTSLFRFTTLAAPRQLFRRREFQR